MDPPKLLLFGSGALPRGSKCLIYMGPRRDAFSTRVFGPCEASGEPIWGLPGGHLGAFSRPLRDTFRMSFQLLSRVDRRYYCVHYMDAMRSSELKLGSVFLFLRPLRGTFRVSVRLWSKVDNRYYIHYLGCDLQLRV